MLLRNTSSDGGGIEVLMVRRTGTARFAPGAYVFPGGRVEGVDCSPTMELRCSGLDRRGAFGRMPDADSSEGALGAWVAALRETFEEVGILLACDADGTLLGTDTPEDARFAVYRRQLHAGQVSLDQLLDKEQLRLALDRVLYFGHWITPEAAAIRYDVRFFVAAAPLGQAATHDGIELTGHRWVQPRKALSESDAGDFPMVLPTRMMLRELAGFQTVEDALRSAASKTIPSILSTIVLRSGERIEVMPDEVGPGDRPLRGCDDT